jgi:putative endonuclease
VAGRGAACGDGTLERRLPSASGLDRMVAAQLMPPCQICHPERSEGSNPVVSERRYYVYIMASLSRVLYTGVTCDLTRRVYQHRCGAMAGFSSKYRVDRLVYFEETPNSCAAVSREREIKGWVREKKCRLIESINSGWVDLASDWFSA